MQSDQATSYFLPPANMREHAERMHRITGFVTTLCSDSDKRPLVFSRYFHVRRVVWTATVIAERRIAAGTKVDLEKVQWLSWAHDLNRWPFAHNSEKGLFDQGANVATFFPASGLTKAPEILKDLRSIIDKHPDRLSNEGAIVLLADILTGFIEDPLWITTALDLHPSFVPDDVGSYLCMPLNQNEVMQELFELNQLFENATAVEPFETEFDKLFCRFMRDFLEQRKLAESLPFGKPEFEQWRLHIKEDFMRKKIFAYNNEKISKGSSIRKKIVDPLYKALGDAAIPTLTTVDEPAAILMAQQFEIISPDDLASFVPSLDYVERYEPSMSFRRRARSGRLLMS